MKYRFQAIPREIRYLFTNLVILLFFLLLFRLAFYLFFLQRASGESDVLWQAWLQGGTADLGLVFWVLLPVFLWLNFSRGTFFEKKGAARRLLLYFSFIDLLFLVIYILDLNSYAYFGRRLHPDFFHYFAGAGKRSFWQTFPWVSEALLVVVLMYILCRLHEAAYRRFVPRGASTDHQLSSKWWYGFTGLLLCIGLVATAPRLFNDAGRGTVEGVENLVFRQSPVVGLISGGENRRH